MTGVTSVVPSAGQKRGPLTDIVNKLPPHGSHTLPARKDIASVNHRCQANQGNS